MRSIERLAAPVPRLHTAVSPFLLGPPSSATGRLAERLLGLHWVGLCWSSAGVDAGMLRIAVVLASMPRCPGWSSASKTQFGQYQPVTQVSFPAAHRGDRTRLQAELGRLTSSFTVATIKSVSSSILTRMREIKPSTECRFLLQVNSTGKLRLYGLMSDSSKAS